MLKDVLVIMLSYLLLESRHHKILLRFLRQGLRFEEYMTLKMGNLSFCIEIVLMFFHLNGNSRKKKNAVTT